MPDLYLPAAEGPGADADGWNGDTLRDHLRQRRRNQFEDDCVGPGFSQRLCVRDQVYRIARSLPLHPESTELVHGLWCEADVSHHGDAGVDQVLHGFRGAGAAFELHGVTTGLLQDPRGVLERVLPAALVRTERHVHDYVRTLRAAHHGLAVVDHFVDRHRDRGVVAEHHHAERVTHQQQWNAGFVGHPRGRIVVRRQHSDWLTTLAHALEVEYGNSLRHHVLPSRSNWIQAVSDRGENALRYCPNLPGRHPYRSTDATIIGSAESPSTVA